MVFALYIVYLKKIAEQPEQAKRLKVETNLEPDNTESASPSVMISDALANFFGSEEREMLQSEALRRVLEYIKVNHQEVCGGFYQFQISVSRLYTFTMCLLTIFMNNSKN